MARRRNREGPGVGKVVDGVKVEFVYADGAKDDVQLSGDWNDWKAIQMFHEGGGMWSVVTPVPPGPHEFKFIVDGEWKHSNRHPTIGIDETSLNNVRYVLPEPDLSQEGMATGAGDPRQRERGSAARPGAASSAPTSAPSSAAAPPAAAATGVGGGVGGTAAKKKGMFGAK
ncbi:SNF1-related protein kinase regulatory subunit beta-2 [Porphyridium purpureum]|uniref:SNF1-related protein kinase regulatory subunit beta-2 n=1 Tax=Porphyridium purpureum TaxID=35688 RepID=A0A5J4Z5H3_PORPP|nr:SNF1-related protein kinase regulatory subunit beta-2 [Porphyridium purpureum]KAA8498093.1 SNF1-related protein kinase regulatory subunit beta-2 [Porphyridium purpureum]|eukprot:POR1874..scf209_3